MNDRFGSLFARLLVVDHLREQSGQFLSVHAREVLFRGFGRNILRLEIGCGVPAGNGLLDTKIWI